MTQRIQTVRVELYATRLDAFRLVLEVALTLCVLAMALGELRSIARVSERMGRGRASHGRWLCAGAPN